MSASTILADQALQTEIAAIVGKGGSVSGFPSLNKAILLQDIEASVLPDHIPSSAAEAIILAVGRPALMIKSGTFETASSDVWNERLNSNRTNIERAIAGVGRIEVKNHPEYEWVGTSWFVADNIVATNRHVADLFAKRADQAIDFRTNIENRRMSARVDLREEYMQPDEIEMNVTRVLHIEPDDSYDLAFLEVELVTGNAPQPIELAESATADSDVAIIGYPAWDGRRNDPEVMRKVFNDIFDVKRLQPGKILTVEGHLIKHDCSTLGGNSGSPLIDIATGKAVGLHFGGRYGKANVAVPSSIVANRLQNL